MFTLFYFTLLYFTLKQNILYHISLNAPRMFQTKDAEKIATNLFSSTKFSENSVVHSA
jgi:hypothetical protein